MNQSHDNSAAAEVRTARISNSRGARLPEKSAAAIDAASVLVRLACNPSLRGRCGEDSSRTESDKVERVANTHEPTAITSDTPRSTMPSIEPPIERLSKLVSAPNERHVPKNKKQNCALTFPEKLMGMLDYAEELKAGMGDPEQLCITWLPSGEGFLVRDPTMCAEEIIPLFFKKAKFSSFARKLYRWGFRQIERVQEDGSPLPPNAMIFACEFFKRDARHEIVDMRSITAAAEKRKMMESLATDEEDNEVEGRSNSPSSNERKSSPDADPVKRNGVTKKRIETVSRPNKKARRYSKQSTTTTECSSEKSTTSSKEETSFDDDSKHPTVSPLFTDDVQMPTTVSDQNPSSDQPTTARRVPSVMEGLDPQVLSSLLKNHSAHQGSDNAASATPVYKDGIQHVYPPFTPSGQDPANLTLQQIQSAILSNSLANASFNGEESHSLPKCTVGFPRTNENFSLPSANMLMSTPQVRFAAVTEAPETKALPRDLAGATKTGSEMNTTSANMSFGGPQVRNIIGNSSSFQYNDKQGMTPFVQSSQPFIQNFSRGEAPNIGNSGLRWQNSSEEYLKALLGRTFHNAPQQRNEKLNQLIQPATNTRNNEIENYRRNRAQSILQMLQNHCSQGNSGLRTSYLQVSQVSADPRTALLEQLKEIGSFNSEKIKNGHVSQTSFPATQTLIGQTRTQPLTHSNTATNERLLHSMGVNTPYRSFGPNEQRASIAARIKALCELFSSSHSFGMSQARAKQQMN